MRRRYAPEFWEKTRKERGISPPLIEGKPIRARGSDKSGTLKHPGVTARGVVFEGKHTTKSFAARREG